LKNTTQAGSGVARGRVFGVLFDATQALIEHGLSLGQLAGEHAGESLHGIANEPFARVFEKLQVDLLVFGESEAFSDELVSDFGDSERAGCAEQLGEQLSTLRGTRIGGGRWGQNDTGGIFIDLLDLGDWLLFGREESFESVAVLSDQGAVAGDIFAASVGISAIPTTRRGLASAINFTPGLSFALPFHPSVLESLRMHVLTTQLQ
jgi:hypothetical protein